ncbi:AAA family ATPase [Mesorhizobium sp. M0046]|uniref:AAA family ATPase n=1 Tax=Mesorhizobium sp. M0046 TaxID=2956858 RepID=UPI00333AFFDB
MRIKKVRLKNGYKRFRDLTIDLGDSPARIVALVGPNGCGKSSVLDGLLFHHNAHGRLGNSDARDYTYHSMDAHPTYDYQNVEVTLTDGPYSEVRQALNAKGKGSAIFSFRSPYRYNSRLKITEARATEEIRLNNYGAADASSLDAKMEDNYRRLFALVNRYMETNDVKPSDARNKILGDLNESIRNCLDLEVSSVGNVEDSRGTLYFRKRDHPKEFEFNVLSSGEKEVVDILMDLYLRRTDYNETIFLIDEPELHINTAIQGRLLKEINKLIGDNCQIWLTTHSIGFLRALQAEMKDTCQVIQFRSDYELASKAYTLTPMKPTAGGWRDLFAIALDDLAALVSPKTIIYCEGRAEPGQGGAERGIDAKVYNSIFAHSYPDALFVSSGGNTELDQRSAIAIAVLGKVFPTVDVLLLKDRDMASGKATTENDRHVYLTNNPNNHRVLKRWEIENYLYEKDVLRSYCSDKGLQFDEADYDLFVTDIVDQNLKDQTARIRNICGIKGSVSADTFKIALSNYVSPGMTVFAELEACIFDRA